MSDALSFAEIDGQHLELLPARTVLISMNPNISVDHILDFTGGTATSGAGGAATSSDSESGDSGAATGGASYATAGDGFGPLSLGL
ncbi:MAG TPA: hypothetical protein VGJ13_13300 [Pseudonocardiaceae bacterium]|jgi:hypothetical protein